MAKKKTITQAVIKPDTFSQNISSSHLEQSVVERYCNTDGSDSIESFSKSVQAFKRETSVILRFGSPFYFFGDSLRQENIKLYIIKVLLFVGTSPNGNGIAVLARLMEILTLHPELALEEVISDFAKTHSATVNSVTHVIEKYFNIYDNYFYERVVALTESHPMTAKDVLCDLSVFIRAKYMSKPEL